VSARFTVDEVAAALGRPPAHAPDSRAVFERVSIDSRRVRDHDLFVAIRGERHDGNAFLCAAVRAGATGAVGEDREFPGRERIAFWPTDDGRRALQSLAGFHRRRLDVEVVAVTGSNGKTTTKELVAAALSQGWPTARTKGNLNNQVGVPLTLFEIEPDHRWAVVELGMNRPGEIAPLARISRPGIGIVTNVAASHLEGLGTIADVLDEKMELARALGPDDLLVYGGDQRIVREVAEGLPCRTISYGLEPHNDLVPERWDLDEEGRGRFVLDGRTFRLRLAGAHNILNALAAVAVAREAGLDDGRIARGLADPGGLPMRMQLERWGEVVALVDCYNANPESVVSAALTLKSLTDVRRRVAVLGEMLELGDEAAAFHDRVGRELALREAVDLVVTVGEGASAIADGAAAEGVDVARFTDHESAVAWLAEHLAPGDAVLFKASRGVALEHVVGPVRSACLDGIARVGR